MVKKLPVINEERLVKQQNEVNLQGILILFVVLLDVGHKNLSGNVVFWIGLFLAVVALMRIVGSLVEE